MDTSAAAAGPWIVLGVVLGVALMAVAAVLAVQLGRTPSSPDPSGPSDQVDDLPAFLERPPGGPGDDPATDGWVALSTPAPGPAETGRGRWSPTGRALAAMATTALLLIGVAAAVAAGAVRGDASAAPPADPGPTTPVQVGARLTFGGVVLERRAIGVTASYPRVTLDGSGDVARATVELPTFNCLAAEAPADPEAAGCTRVWTEYAELSAPELAVTREGDRIQLTGQFATWLRPNGSPPAPTGRSYELTITAAPTGPPAAGGWMPAEGTLQLADDHASARAGQAELRYPR